MATVNRRSALGIIAASGAAAGCATSAVPEAVSESNAAFRYGVASGDPGSDSVVLWTRVESESDSEPVQWAIALDAAFAAIIQRGESTARRDADHTVKVIVAGLEPGRSYFYRFEARGLVSPVGRTRTLPIGRVERLGVALVSCSNYAFGHFNAYDAIARDTEVDVVLHTGDYIYEYGADEWGDDVGTALGRRHDPPHEIVTLDDYRRRHAQYKSDAGSRAMLAAHPLLCCWDDHESANNPWMNGAQNHQSETEGVWAVRRANALRAYYEWMPIRDPGGDAARAEFWRTYVFGDLATLVTLETRHTGRGEQVKYSDHFARIQTADDRDAFMRDVIGDPTRRMLSEPMEAALLRGLTASVDAGQPWRVIGNASPIARMLVPDVAALGVDPNARVGYDPGAEPTPDLFWTGRWNLPFYTDTWDGYPAAREAFYALCRQAGAGDLVVLTGDSHSFWMNALADGEGRPMGLEIGTAGVTSPGDFVDSGWDAATAERLDRIFEQELDEVVWTDNLHQGYVRIVLDRVAGEASFVAVDTVLSPDYRAVTLRTARIERDGDGLRFV